MAEPTAKKPEPPKEEPHAHAAPASETPTTPKAPRTATSKPVQKKASPPKPTPEATKGPSKPGPATKKPKETETKPAAKEAKAKEVKIVEAPAPAVHTPRAKPQLSKEQRARLALRATIDRRRPAFRRQQWYEYKRLENSGWRRPTGVDSAMRRHFGYEQSVVRVGFRGPADVRGLHPSGFREVRVETMKDLDTIDPKRQAARVARTLGRRRLVAIYEAADKKGIRILNRRKLE